MAHCRSCGASIIWANTEARDDKPSKAIPMNFDPDPAGNCLVVHGDTVRVLGKEDAAAARASGKTLFVSHWATCPKSWQHRK
jgi:hypothetical protein